MAEAAESSGRWKPSVNPWLIAATVALAAFMEVLDTSIANVALPHIAGSLGASADQRTWVLTPYVGAEDMVVTIRACAATRRAGHDGRLLRAFEARPRLFALWISRGAGSIDRTDAGRMDYRQL